MSVNLSPRQCQHPDFVSTVAAVISLAHALGKRTVAEGIEASAQVERLRALACDVGQGFHYAKPSPAGQLGYGL
jgi:EAL domain-containing protein (putative c-di-GMP-specific phosphodiesterase class I)